MRTPNTDARDFDAAVDALKRRFNATEVAVDFDDLDALIEITRWNRAAMYAQRRKDQRKGKR